MRTLVRRFAAGLAALLVVVAGAVWAREVSVTAVPKPALQKVKSWFKDALLAGAAAETTATGQLVYEVTLKERGRNIDVTVTPEGVLTLIEKEITRRELPRAIADTLGKRYPRARYRIVEQVFEVEADRQKLAYFEVLLVDAAKRRWAVELGLDGAVRNIEDKTHEDEEEE